jgi:hypothetical protein
LANEYLFKEYELCFQQLRFYDERQESLLKYLCTLTASIATAEFAIYQFLHGATLAFFRCESFLSGLVFFATVLLFSANLQNRLYFVLVARQINALRAHLMEAAGDGFTKNQLYTSTSFPALKPLSVHTLLLVSTALISALFAGASIYGLLSASPYGPVAGTCTAAVVLVAEAGGGIAYLMSCGKKSADHAIHHQKAKG